MSVCKCVNVCVSVWRPEAGCSGRPGREAEVEAEGAGRLVEKEQAGREGQGLQKEGEVFSVPGERWAVCTGKQGVHCLALEQVLLELREGLAPIAGCRSQESWEEWGLLSFAYLKKHT